MIGDSVLKFVVSCHLFTHFPEWNEGSMTGAKCQLISNRHLFIAGKKRNLGPLLAGSIFVPESSWLPPGVEIPGSVIDIAVNNNINYDLFASKYNNAQQQDIDFKSCSRDDLTIWLAEQLQDKSSQAKTPIHTTYTHSKLGDKSIADGVEALIGAYYLNGGIDSAICFMDWVGLKGPTKDPNEVKPYKYIRDMPRVIPEYPITSNPETVIPYISEIEEVLNYRYNRQIPTYLSYIRVSVLIRFGYFQLQESVVCD